MLWQKSYYLKKKQGREHLLRNQVVFLVSRKKRYKEVYLFVPKVNKTCENSFLSLPNLEAHILTSYSWKQKAENCSLFFVSCSVKHLFDIQSWDSVFSKYPFSPARLVGSDKPCRSRLFHGHLFELQGRALLLSKKRKVGWSFVLQITFQRNYCSKCFFWVCFFPHGFSTVLRSFFKSWGVSCEFLFVQKGRNEKTFQNRQRFSIGVNENFNLRKKIGLFFEITANFYLFIFLIHVSKFEISSEVFIRFLCLYPTSFFSQFYVLFKKVKVYQLHFEAY